MSEVQDIMNHIEQVGVRVVNELQDVKVHTRQAVRESREILNASMQDESQENKDNWEDLFERLNGIQIQQVELKAKLKRNRSNIQAVANGMERLENHHASERNQLEQFRGQSKENLSDFKQALVRYEQAQLYMWIVLTMTVLVLAALTGLVLSPMASPK